MSLTIKTDNKFKFFAYRADVPAKVLADQFSHLPEDSDDGLDNFFCYRGRWYHISDFMRIDNAATDLKGWDGYSGDSYFSGVLLKVSRDGDRYKAATYFS